MDCTTVRKGKPCPFMTAKGCTYNGGSCHGVVEQCSGCNRSLEFESGWYCGAFPEPAKKWKKGACNFATHVSAKNTETTNGKLNPIKASKRARR